MICNYNFTGWISMSNNIKTLAFRFVLEEIAYLENYKIKDGWQSYLSCKICIVHFV